MSHIFGLRNSGSSKTAILATISTAPAKVSESEERTVCNGQNAILVNNLSEVVPLVTSELRDLASSYPGFRQKLRRGFPIGSAEFKREPTSDSAVISENSVGARGGIPLCRRELNA